MKNTVQTNETGIRRDIRSSALLNTDDKELKKTKLFKQMIRDIAFLKERVEYLEQQLKDR